ncbi:hypothetical protein BS47DRAFT_1348219 [Hydnum rufescens UP504]|uniref:Galactose oxidase n=1 Tax=Hydnum rufescens UP504 TaxID=1448309 RepID=A0A9P6AR00_9AGAM|nr:hypothetical protein BS47DRAFT_1348219 [Hydnum rufescens UP504]
MSNPSLRTFFLFRYFSIPRKRCMLSAPCLLSILAFDAACTIVSNTLYVHGGKVDPSNQFSYTSAPNTNQLLTLDLSSPFPLWDPPWHLVTGSRRPPGLQGPAVSFHTLTAFSHDRILAFGGYGGPPMPIETYPDSAWLLTNLTGAIGPTWVAQPPGWANEPIRRMYHTATAVDGKVWITGGEKADGSGLGFNTTYQYVPAVTFLSSGSFNPVASDIPEMVGHGSILLSNGTLVLFGGYSTSQSALLPLSQLWMLDTKSPGSSWTSVAISGTIPSPRRNFAYALLDGGKILVHGGSDAPFQSVFSDGAILDIGSRSWSVVDAISTLLGPRHDHFAIGLGSQVMFGFGYTADGPAPADLFIYDTLLSAFVFMFVPPATSTWDNPPGMPSPTGNSTTFGGSSGLITQPYSSTAGPTSAVSGNVSTNQPTGTSSRGPGQTAGSGSGTSKTGEKLGIALGVAFGAIALIAIATVVSYWALKDHRYYTRRRDPGPTRVVWTSEAFGADGSDDHGDGVVSSHLEDTLPVAAVSGWEPVKRRNSAWAVLGRGTKIPTNRNGKRFDMLADEDEPEFEELGPTATNRRSPSRRSWTDVVNDGVSSVKSFGVAIGRKVSGGSRTSPDWWEKDAQFLEDEARLLSDSTVLDTGGRATHVEMMSHAHGSEAASTMRSQTSYYRDPYTDGIENEPLIGAQASRSNSKYEEATQHPAAGTSSGVKEAYPVSSIPPRNIVIPLTPVISGPSDQSHSSGGSRPQSSGGSRPQSSGSSSGRILSSAETHTTTQSTAPSNVLRRSDSWWSRFSRSPRGGTDSSSSGSNGARRLSFRRSGPLSPSLDPKYSMEFRDPNPPPAPVRLGAIEESGNTPEDSPRSAGPRDAPDNLKVVPSAYAFHGRSTSSLQTAVTGDSDMLERMGGKVPVIKRMQTASTTHSPTPSSSLSASSSEQRDMIVGFNSEIGEASSSTATRYNVGKGVLTGPRPPPSPRKGRLNLPPAGVPDRIAEYERRTVVATADRHSGGTKLSSPLTETVGEQKERRSKLRDSSTSASARVEWGLANRPSLFLANPDNRQRQGSDDTVDATDLNL